MRQFYVDNQQNFVNMSASSKNALLLAEGLSITALVDMGMFDINYSSLAHWYKYSTNSININ